MKFKYRVTNHNGFIYFECLNGGVGSLGKRIVAASKGLYELDLLNKMQIRDHLVFSIYLDGQRLTENEWNRLLALDEVNDSEVEFIATCDWDVITVVGIANTLILYPQLTPKRGMQKFRYDRPTSKKAEQNRLQHEAA